MLSLDGEQGKEDTTTTTEAVIGDGSEREQQQQQPQGDETGMSVSVNSIVLKAS